MFCSLDGGRLIIINLCPIHSILEAWFSLHIIDSSNHGGRIQFLILIQPANGHSLELFSRGIHRIPNSRR